jgi:serine/threonine-protein kinase RsbW
MTSATLHAVRIGRRFPATLEGIDKFCAEAREAVDPLISRKDRFAMEILLREALINAVVHGSRNDPGKEVDCTLRIDRDRLRIAVLDGGPGFERRKARRTTGDPRGESGRGLRICWLYATKMRFNRKGNRVVITRMLDRGEDND